MECELSSYFDPDHFPEVVLSPHELFLEESYAGLLRPSDEFAAKVSQHLSYVIKDIIIYNLYYILIFDHF